MLGVDMSRTYAQELLYSSLVFGVDDIPWRAFPAAAGKQQFGHRGCFLFRAWLDWDTGAMCPVSWMADFGIDIGLRKWFSAAEFVEVELALVVEIGEIHQVGLRCCRRDLTIHEELLTDGVVSM